MASDGQSEGKSPAKSAGQTGGQSTTPSAAAQSPLKHFVSQTTGKVSSTRFLADGSSGFKAHNGWTRSEERLLCRGLSILVLSMLFVVACMFFFFSIGRVTVVMDTGWNNNASRSASSDKYLDGMAIRDDSVPSRRRSSRDEALGAEEAGSDVEGDLVTAGGFDSEDLDYQGDVEDQPDHEPKLARGEEDSEQGSVPQEEW